MGFSRQEYWSGLPSPPGDLPNPGIKPESLMSPALAGEFFITSAPGKRAQTTHAKVQRPGGEPGQKSPGSLSIWQGQLGRCSATSLVSTSHRHAIHTWPGQWPCAHSPCPASACAASSLQHPGSGLHLSPSSPRAKPVSSSMMGEGERRAPESITGYHRVWQWPQG